MARVRVRCAECGPIVLPSDRIDLVVGLGRPIELGSAHYGFECTRCGSYFQRPVDAGTAAKLILAGVVARESPEPAPAMVPHPESPPGGPTFNHDDLLDLHLLLDDPRWWQELIEHEVGTPTDR